MTTKCIKHEVEDIKVHNADKFQFICTRCGTIITKQNKDVFDKALVMIELLTSLGEEVSQ